MNTDNTHTRTHHKSYPEHELFWTKKKRKNIVTSYKKSVFLIYLLNIITSVSQQCHPHSSNLLSPVYQSLDYWPDWLSSRPPGYCKSDRSLLQREGIHTPERFTEHYSHTQYIWPLKYDVNHWIFRTGKKTPSPQRTHIKKKNKARVSQLILPTWASVSDVPPPVWVKPACQTLCPAPSPFAPDPVMWVVNVNIGTQKHTPVLHKATSYCVTWIRWRRRTNFSFTVLLNSVNLVCGPVHSLIS